MSHAGDLGVFRSDLRPLCAVTFQTRYAHGSLLRSAFPAPPGTACPCAANRRESSERGSLTAASGRLVGVFPFFSFAFVAVVSAPLTRGERTCSSPSPP